MPEADAKISRSGFLFLVQPDRYWKEGTEEFAASGGSDLSVSRGRRTPGSRGAPSKEREVKAVTPRGTLVLGRLVEDEMTGR